MRYSNRKPGRGLWFISGYCTGAAAMFLFITNQMIRDTQPWINAILITIISFVVFYTLNAFITQE